MSNTMTRNKKFFGPTAATFLVLFIIIAILKRFQR